MSYIESVKNLKQDPSANMKARKELNVDPKNFVAIEDSVRGIEAAIVSDIKTIQGTNYSVSKKEYPGPHTLNQ